jgi:hypothetical protein
MGGRMVDASIGGGACMSLKDGLVQYLRFDEGQGSKAYDIAISAYAPIVGAMTWGLGVVGGSIGNNGTASRYVNTADLTFGTTDDWSCSCWLKLTTVSSYQFLIGRRGNTYPHIGQLNGTSLFRDGAGTYHYGPTITANTWAHLVFVYDAGVGLYIYKDKILGATHTDCTSTAMYFQAIGETYYNVTYQYQLNGEIDDYRVWNRVLTATEVTWLCRNPGCIDMKRRYLG